MIILAYFCRCLKILPCAALPELCMAQLQVVQTRGAPTLVLLQATAVCTGTLVKLGPCLYKMNAITALHEWLCIFLDIKYEATKSLCLDMQHCIVNTGKNWLFSLVRLVNKSPGSQCVCPQRTEKDDLRSEWTTGLFWETFISDDRFLPLSPHA